MTSSPSSESRTSNLPYRRGVGAMLVNDRGLVFVGQRIDTKTEAWQMPQGGIDKGETPEDALFRELEEEIGTRKAHIMAQTKDWLSYDLPDDLQGRLWRGRFRGQTQKWFALRFTGQDQDICIETAHPEFRAWAWMPLADLDRTIVPFKRDLYAAVLKELGPFATPL